MTLGLTETEVLNSTNGDVKAGDAHLQAIKEWLAKQPHLPDTWDDAALMTFLRWGGFSLEKTKIKLDAYFTMRTALPELFSNRNMKRPDLQEATKQVMVCSLPTLTVDGNRILVLRLKERFSSNLLLEAIIKLSLMVADIRLIEESAELTGEIFIVDAGTITAAHCAQVSLSLLKKSLTAAQVGYPEKIKQIHVVNVHPLFEQLFNLVKIFLKEKIRNRFHFHTRGSEYLSEFLPRHILPEEYGGTGGKLQEINGKWIKKLEEYAHWFQDQEILKVDESKRPGKPTNYDDLFGMEGSFKKLAVD